MGSSATSEWRSRLPRLLQKRFGYPETELAGGWMTVMAFLRRNEIRRDLSLMAPQQHFTWPRLGSVADESLKKFTHSCCSDESSECDNRRLSPSQCGSIALVLSFATFLGS